MWYLINILFRKPSPNPCSAKIRGASCLHCPPTPNKNLHFIPCLKWGKKYIYAFSLTTQPTKWDRFSIEKENLQIIPTFYMLHFILNYINFVIVYIRIYIHLKLLLLCILFFIIIIIFLETCIINTFLVL